ncbi:unnamed protein product [Nezara viridula]|uniref:Uncharacterized protein n=1 Tax=Nezara viridula TaxID=85310 RepID=A0A9P0HGN1_NEZVI|nr:unnamed protein product [Nezara viridula]
MFFYKQISRYDGAFSNTEQSSPETCQLERSSKELHNGISVKQGSSQFILKFETPHQNVSHRANFND